MKVCPSSRVVLVLALVVAGCSEDDKQARDDPSAPPSVRALKVLGCEAGLHAEFAGELDPSSVNKFSVLVENVSGTVAYDPAARAATFRPETPFVSGESYAAVLSSEIRSSHGRPMLDALRWQFTCVDHTPPVVVGRLPIGENISPLAQVTVRFSEALDETTVTAGNIRLVDVDAHPSWDAGSRTVTLVPRRALYPGRSYTVLVSQKVRDFAGNALGADVTWTFRTRAPVDDWVARIVTPPLPAATPCDSPIELRLAPDFDLDVAALAESPLAVDGSPDLAVTWDPGSRLVRITPRMPLRPGLSYDLIATGRLRDRSGDRPFEAGQKLLSIAIVPACEDATVSRVAEHGAVVACDAAAHVAFTAPMDPGTLAASLVLKDLTLGGYDLARAPLVDAAVTLGADGLEATVTPDAPLIDGHRYWVAVLEGARTADGRSLLRTGGWEFGASCE